MMDAIFMQIFIDSASAVINSHIVLHFPKRSVLSMLHRFVTVALKGRKSKDEKTHIY